MAEQAALPKTPEQLAGEVATLMNIAINVVSSASVSSHFKGDLIRLLQRLRDEEVLRLLKCGKEWGK